jgi:hypothetical protein
VHHDPVEITKAANIVFGGVGVYAVFVLALFDVLVFELRDLKFHSMFLALDSSLKRREVIEQDLCQARKNSFR